MKNKYVEPRHNVHPREAIGIAKDWWEFVCLISYDTHFQEYRGPLADEWRRKFVAPLEGKGSLNPLQLDSDLTAQVGRMRLTWTRDNPKRCLSTYEMAVIVYGKPWADAYRAMLKSNLLDYSKQRFDELCEEARNLGLRNF